jgi:hypothetical protein
LVGRVVLLSTWLLVLRGLVEVHWEARASSLGFELTSHLLEVDRIFLIILTDIKVVTNLGRILVLILCLIRLRLLLKLIDILGVALPLLEIVYWGSRCLDGTGLSVVSRYGSRFWCLTDVAL